MNKTERYRSKQLGVAHRLAKDLESVGMLEKKTMHDIDKLCLTPIKKLTPHQITRLHHREDASQAVFAHHLGVSVNLISQWERGEKKPQGASLKLLALRRKERPRLGGMTHASIDATSPGVPQRTSP